MGYYQVFKIFRCLFALLHHGSSLASPLTETTHKLPLLLMPSPLQNRDQLLASTRFWLSIFIAGLILSGVTAFPVERETAWLASLLNSNPIAPDSMILWINKVHDALQETDLRYPFLAYGTDWLAFAHLVLAIAFFGPLRDPVRNKWVIQFGIIACIAVIPLALIAGQFRGIPLPWRLIDCSFGVFGAIPLLICLNRVKHLEQFQQIVLTLNPADFHNDPPTAFR
jgi:hypothetical protein